MTRFPFRVLLIAVLLPFAIAVSGIALQLAWLPELPETIATHWGFDGRPDAFGPAWTTPVLLAVLGAVGFPALFGILLGKTVRPEGPTAVQKLLAVVSLFVVTLLTIITTSSVAIQRGVNDPTAVADILPTFAVAVAIAAVLAVAAWFVLPRAVPGRSAAPIAAPRVPVAPGETVAWIGQARFADWVLVLFGVLVAVVTATVVFVIAIRGAWALAIVPVVLAVAILGTAFWRVRIDADGFSVRPPLGWPHYRIALPEVERAGTTDVVPLGEFGGFGLRWGRQGRVGLITRSGEALEVQRRDGRAIVVTVDDAATAAGVLTALAARSAKD